MNYMSTNYLMRAYYKAKTVLIYFSSQPLFSIRLCNKGENSLTDHCDWLIFKINSHTEATEVLKPKT